MSKDRRKHARTDLSAQAESLSRPAMAVFGKNTLALKTVVPDSIGEQFIAFARERGYATPAECLRELVMVAVIGAEGMADLHRQRLHSLAGNGPEIGTGA